MSDMTEWKGRRLGAYVVGERFTDVPEDEGRLYAAHHVETGEPALVLRPGTSGDWRMSTPCRAETTFFSDPEALVFHPRREAGARRERFHFWSLASIYLAGALAQLDEREDVRTHFMGEVPPVRPRPLRWALAGAAAALVVGFVLLLWPYTAGQPEPRGAADDLPTFMNGPKSSGVIAYKMPEKPFDVQRKPPCIPKTEEEIRGGCWMRHKLDAPCPPGTAEYQGGCYVAVKKPDPEPTSVQP